MRNALDHKRRDRQQDIPNLGTARSLSRRRLRSAGNPIPVPSNNMGLSLSVSVPTTKLSDRMKTGAESRSRETKLNTKPFQSRFNSIQTRTSPRKHKTKKSEEVIEIDSEDEQKQDTFFDAEQEIESNSAKKRRLIRRDSEDKETCLPELKMNRRKTTSSPEEEGVLKKTFQRATRLFKTIIPSVQDPDYKPTKTTDEQPSVSTTVKLPYDPIDDYELIVTGADEHLLTYPFRGKKSVTVYERDLDRLKDETYLNDTLLDVFPKIWSDEYPEANIYTF
ncbi:hypothetical protein CU098_002632, partial [Rhizopus stolonifer]